MQDEIKNWIGNRIRRHKALQFAARKAQSLQYRWLYNRHYRRHPDSVYLKEIHIEPVNYCNLRCKFCALDHQMPKVRIGEPVLVAFFDKWLADKRFHEVAWLHLHNGGESLLHPKMDMVLSTIKKYKDLATAKGIRFPKVSLLTNATILTPERTAMLLQSGVLAQVRFSIDGGDPETFEQIRKRAKWDAVSANVKHFLEANKAAQNPVQTGVICLIPAGRPLSLSGMHPDFLSVIQKADQIEMRRVHGWAGELDHHQDEAPEFLAEKAGCMLALQSLVLLPDGQVTVCCADLNRKGVIGNILDSALIDLYRAPQRLHMLEKLDAGRKEEIPLCQDCESF
jgi:radical SAM protein with 4Fe4S-binding SPASM domain